MILKHMKLIISNFQVLIDGIFHIQSDAIVKVLHQSDAISGVLHQSVAISFFKIQNKILLNLKKIFFCRGLPSGAIFCDGLIIV